MQAIKLSKTWIAILICGLLVSLSGLTILTVLIFRNQSLISTPPTIPPGQPILNDLIAGSLAEQRGHTLWAARYYFAAARLSGNTQLASHAVAMAYRANSAPLLLSTTHLNYILNKKSAQSSYLYAYSLILNQYTQKGILIYAHLLKNNVAHIDDYMPLIPKKIRTQPSFKLALATAEQKLYNHADAMAVIALMYNELNDTASSVKATDRALHIAPDDGLAIQTKVMLYLQQDTPNSAIAFLQKTVSSYPNDTDTKLLLAMLYYNQKQFTFAKPLFQQLLPVPSLNSQSALYLGEIAILEADPALAKQYLAQASLDKTLQPLVNLLLGDLAVNEKKYDDAIKWYDTVNVDPYYFQAQLSIAKTLYLQGNSAAAHQQLGNVKIQDDKEFASLVRFETALYFMDRDWLGARDYLNKAIAALPDNPDILYALVVTNEQLGRYNEAKQVLLHTLEVAPHHIDSLNAMGELLAIQYQQYNEAESYLNRALALDPNNSETLHTLGLVYYQTAHYNEAITLLQRAYSLDNNSNIAADLGEVLWVDGQSQQATAVWENALKEDPHNPQLKATMKRFLP